MTIRTYGLSGSGMDVDQMVKDMMKAQRARYDSIGQKKTQTEWKKADYYSEYTNVSDFRNTVFNYKLTSATSPKQASSTDEKVVKASAAADAANVSHNIAVSKLAEGANLTSSGSITDTSTSKGKDTLVNQFYGGTAPSPATFDIKISDGTTAKTITVDTSKSIYEFASSINNAGLNIRANYDANLDKFFIYSTQTGTTAKIDFAGTDPTGKGIDFLNNKLKLQDKNNVSIDTTKAVQGVDAAFTLDGQSLTQSSNSFTIVGVTYNLQAVSADMAKPTTVTVSPDNEKTIASVHAFVDAYNNALSKITTELNETKYKDYLPLTDDQRSDMSESEIKTWEEKAKSGSLRRDSTLRIAADTMRNNIASPVSSVSGIYNSLSAIGITTGVYTENGKLHINDTQLKTALEADPDIVNKLFTAKGTEGDTSSQGIATRLYNSLKTTMDSIATTAGRSAGISDDTESALAKQITNYTKQLSSLKTKLADMEERYYKQFDAMETALSNLNKQSSWLSQQLGTSS